MKDHMSLAPDHSNTRASTAGSPPTGSSLNSAYREMLEAPVMAVSFGTVVGATLIYSISGPLGIEDTLAVGQRLLYLGLCAFICWPLCHSLSTTILYVMRHRTPYQILLAAVAGAAFMAIPCSAVAYAVFGVAGQSYNGGFADIYLNTSLALAACSTVVHYAACLRARLSVAAQAASAAVRAINRDASSPEPAQSPPEPKSGDIRRARDKPESTTPAATSPYRPTTGTQAANAKRSIFLDRMPENLGQDVIYLNVSGHYVNAATTVGSGVILMRFADAIAELGDMGIQVHRSYWVAHRHIDGDLPTRRADVGPRHRRARSARKSHVPYGRPGVHSSRRKGAAHPIASQLADKRFPSPNRTRASRNLRSHSSTNRLSLGRNRRSDGDRSLDLTQLLLERPITIRLLSDTNPVRRCHVALMLHDTTSEADRYYVGDGGIPELHSLTQAPERRLFSVRPRRMKVIHEEVGSE